MFTVIVPSVRKGSLEYAVDSVINQTYPHWNMIVAGDGVCVPAFDDRRILSIIAPHKADASATRMYAAMYATEEWIVFLDDDDWVEPWYLESFLPLLHHDIIISQMDNYGNVVPPSNVIEHGFVGISFAVRREFLLQNPLPPAPSEDYVFLKKMEFLGASIGFTHKCGYWVRKYLHDSNFRSTV